MIKLYHKYQEIINYLIVGILTTLVSLITYYLLTITILSPNNPITLQLANVISWILSVTFAYFTNRKYVFFTKKNISLKEVSSFYLSRISTLLIDMLLMYFLVTILLFNDKIIKLIVQVIVIVLNYLFSKFFVFNKTLKK